MTNGSKIPFVDNQKGVTMLCTFVAFSLVLINSVVSEVDPDDEKFATVSQNTGKENASWVDYTYTYVKTKGISFCLEIERAIDRVIFREECFSETRSI